MGAEGKAAFKEIVASSAPFHGYAEAKASVHVSGCSCSCRLMFEALTRDVVRVGLQSLSDQLLRAQAENKRHDDNAKQLQAKLIDADTRMVAIERDKRDLQLLVSTLERQLNELVRGLLFAVIQLFGMVSQPKVVVLLRSEAVIAATSVHNPA